jgi:nicotinamide riboside kinase
MIDFGDVIFGEQNTQYLKLNNTGALTTKIYAKTADGRTVPFVTLDELKARE